MTEALGEQGPSFLDSLGDRSRRRAEPRTSVSLAGAGCALGVLGVLILAGDTGLDDDTGEFSQLPGLLLSGLLVALGYFVLSATGRGALATAGTVAAALGVPAFMFFLTFDEEGFPPYNTEAILFVTTVVWLGSYLIGPARGRPWFLGSGLIGFWFSILELAENLFEAPFYFVGFWFGGGGFDSTDEFGNAIEPRPFDPPDPTTIGLLSLGLGVAFVLVGRWLDRDQRHGAATPFAFAAIPCLAVGVLGLGEELEVAGSGLLLVLIGVVLAWNGATIWRRGTSWIGGATAALGLAMFLGDMADDSATTGGMLYIAGGIGLVFLGHLISTAINEPDEMAITAGAIAAVTGPTRRVLVAEPQTPPPPDPDDHAAFQPPVPPPPTPTDDD
jgi:hypothetical protein